MVANAYELVSTGSGLPPQPIPRHSTPRSRRWLILIAIFTVLLALGLVGDMMSPEPYTPRIAKNLGVELPFTAVEGQSLGIQSKHREPISVVLIIGNNDHNIIEVIQAILSLTVGPYEIIAVFAGDRDVSHNIVASTITSHQEAKVDKLGRGLRGYTSIDLSSWDTEDIQDESERKSAGKRGVGAAKYGAIAILDGNDMVREYGWDRILLTGLKSSNELLAVSGRGAANLEEHRGNYRLVNQVGVLGAGSQDVTPSGETVEVRDVVMRSPILYNATKLQELGGLRTGAEIEGLGDLEVCLRGRKEYQYVCGYYPVSMETNEEWESVPGQLELVDGRTLGSTAAGTLDLGDYNILEGVNEIGSTISAVPREIEDIPTTIVTAFSGNHQRSARHLLSTLPLNAPHTRLVVYLMKSDRPICLDILKHPEWNTTEIRYFDFDSRPSWMDLSKSKGEYAWKIQMVEEVIRDYGGLVLWLDTGDGLKGDTRGLWVDIAMRGIWTTPSGGPLSTWTHPAMLAYFDMPQSLWDNVNCNAANIGFNSHNARAMTTVIRPLIACSANRDCIAPKGSSRENHRQDQAALTVLVHLNGYTCELNGPIETQRDDPTEWDEVCEGETY